MNKNGGVRHSTFADSLRAAREARASWTASAAHDDTASVVSAEVPALPRIAALRAFDFDKAECKLAELLALHDFAFVDGAFRMVLGRPPDGPGIEHFLDALRTSRLTKVEIVGRLRYSPEGRGRRIRIRGLPIAFAAHSLSHLPLVGKLIAIFIGVIRLPALSGSVQRLESDVFRDRQALATTMNETATVVESAFERVQTVAIEARRIADLSRDAFDSLDVSTRHRLDQIRENMLWQPELDRLRALLEAMFAKASREAYQKTQMSIDRLRGDVGQIRGSMVGKPELDRLQASLEAAARNASLEDHQNSQDSIERLRGDMEEIRGNLLGKQLKDGQETQALIDCLRSDLESAVTDVVATRAAARLEALETEVSNRSPIDDINKILMANQEAQSQLVHEWGALAASKVEHSALEDLDVRLARQLSEATTNLRDAAAEIRARVLRAEVELIAQRRNVIELGRSLDGRSPAVASPADAPVSGRASGRAKPKAFDAFYAGLEDHFRGSREAVKARMRGYLDHVSEAGVGFSDSPVVDVGSGRGEWLEVLRDEARVAYGIDTNVHFVEECRALGLEVRHSDAFVSLAAIPVGSVGAVTSMHLVEHLPFDNLLALVDQSFRILRPGGMIVLETPNPENLAVAANSFYLDPTHRNPIPPPLLEFIVGARGFHRVRIERLDSERGFERPALVDPEVPGADSLNRVIELLRAAPDYAVIAYKP